MILLMILMVELNPRGRVANLCPLLLHFDSPLGDFWHKPLGNIVLQVY